LPSVVVAAGLNEEYQQARHWVANHLEFRDGSKVQFFEVNIRILGGLLSAYYLSGGDDMFLQKAEMLADRCVPHGFGCGCTGLGRMVLLL
jgi:mannosyl-oligosaccharide alpha-1,2-mannosidase